MQYLDCYVGYVYSQVNKPDIRRKRTSAFWGPPSIEPWPILLVV